MSNTWPGRLARSPLFLLCCFAAFLAFFFWHSVWYPGAKISLSGVVSQVPARLILRWASSYGLNGYEMYKFFVQPLPAQADRDGVPVTIRPTGARNPASNGNDVILSGVFVDGEKLAHTGDPAQEVDMLDGGMLRLRAASGGLTIPCRPRHHIRLEFQSFNHAGEVEVEVAGELSRHDLYSAWDLTSWTKDSKRVIEFWYADADGRFAVAMTMPRYRVKAFRLDAKESLSQTSLTIRTEDGQILQGGSGTAVPEGVFFSAQQLNSQLKRHFHPHRFAMQVVFALLSTWIVWGVARRLSRYKGLTNLCCEKRRWLFWLMLGCSLTAYGIWHLAFWPGIASTDSLKIWRAAHMPGTYLGDHPPLNIVWNLYLMQFWDNMAVVPLAQNLLTSLLFTWIFFSLHRWGLPLRWLVPCHLLTVLSIPVGMYTAVLWKDVPFALLIVLLGFRLGDMYFRKKKEKLLVSPHEWLVLALLTLALIGFRHNGVVYLLALPVLLLLLGIVTIRLRVILACAGFLLVLVGAMALSQKAGSSALHFLTSQALTYGLQAAKRLSPDYVLRQGGRYLGALDVNQQRMAWDHVAQTVYWRHNGNFLKAVGWNDVYGYLPLPRSAWQKHMARSALEIGKTSYKTPWVYLSWNPWYMLVILALLPCCIRWLPMAGVFSSFVMIQVLALVLLDIFNWRYYYFTYLALLLLVPLALTDRCRLRQRLTAASWPPLTRELPGTGGPPS